MDRNNKSNSFNLLLKKKTRSGLGFSVKQRRTMPFVEVSYIMKGGSADQSGLLHVGDVIIAVNHFNIEKMEYSKALNLLREVAAGGSVLLMVQPSSPIVEYIDQSGNLVMSRDIFQEVRPVGGRAISYGSKNGLNKYKRLQPISTNNMSYNKVIFPEKQALKTGLGEKTESEKQVFENTTGKEKNTVLNKKKENLKPSSSTLLQNYESGSKHKETLHEKAESVNICSLNECRGSLMNPPNMTCDPSKDKQTADDVRRLAKGFLEQYYESTKRSGSEAHQNRLKEVMKSIDLTGTYELTYNELNFGAKMAWRNAPRCIGRQQWNKLQVFDCRQVTTTQEMYQALCNHLKFGTNKGNIRSAITFFPPRKDGDVSKEFRVWNNQIIRYAAYRQDDDSIIGDPINLEFTQICEKLGWKGKGGRFDVLPWILQANGEDPDFYDVPEELVLEVKITHPDYKCFEELDLKWYAVPGVSNIMLNIGGIEFCAAPFNGWFMGTEIGRDLCDEARYDLLPQIAEGIGLDTKRTSSLWKDTALLEMNVAILYSFQSQNVTIMDHHVASESFMKFFHNELKVRGGCPADWVWLVPPISGSACPVFHQEFFNYVINPACLYQPNPWRSYKFKNVEKLKTKRKIGFKELARSVMMTSNFMKTAMSKRIRATILYATETGKSFEFSKMLKQLFDHAFDGKIIAMEDYDLRNLEYESLVLVVTSTFGNGDPPENGEEFAKNLSEMNLMYSEKENHQQKASKFQCVATAKPIVKRASTLNLSFGKSKTTAFVGHLANVRFSVFGLGSRAYPHFCAFAHAVDTLFGELGAERMLEVGEGDELSGQAESFRKWSKSVFNSACQEFCVDNSKIYIDDFEDDSYDEKRHKIRTVSTIGLEDYVSALSKLHKKKVMSCKLKDRTNLQSPSSGRSTILVKLKEQSEKSLDYEPGDHLGVYPKNNSKIVQEIIDLLGDVPDDKTLIEIEYLKIKKTPMAETKKWEKLKRLPSCSLRVALSRYLDICSPPSQRLLEVFSQNTTNTTEKNKLIELSQDSTIYDEWCIIKVPNLVTVLKEFPSIKVTIPLLFTQLPLLQVRYYSISSSIQVHPGEVHATVSVVKYNTHGGQGEPREGVCSNYLNVIDRDEDVACFIRRCPAFHLPKDSTKPCILVGPGTGIAPFRSFWQQRSHDKTRNSTMALLFGCRHSEQDHIYKEEVEECLRSKALSHAYTAYSRDNKFKKKYVQHIIENEIASFVVEKIVEQNGHFYVCGDVKMANGVSDALKKVLVTHGKMNKLEADNYVTKMKFDGRYHEDIFGITLRTFEVKQTVRENTRRNSIASNSRPSTAMSESLLNIVTE